MKVLRSVFIIRNSVIGKKDTDVMNKYVIMKRGEIEESDVER